MIIMFRLSCVSVCRIVMLIAPLLEGVVLVDFSCIHISYLILVRRIALQRKLVFKGASDKTINYNP